ncbi:MAG TPA: FAD-binding oxidoreductase [Candidatus Margulisiibacteriota bacterium]|nr:FAD-binding oxidoreductase [Candidatus Margulisiibacteriota bacterium]
MTENTRLAATESRAERQFSRRALLGGMAMGVAGAWGLSSGLARLAYDPAKPPQLYEYFLDNFWFEAADLEHQALNPPLKGNHTADIVIIGGGYTGLSSAYHLSRTFPNKKIVLLEGACCGYGASGRNGGFCDAGFSGLLQYVESVGPERGRQAFDASLFGINQIKRLVAEEGVQCDFEENGMLETAMNEEQAKQLEHHAATYKAMGLETTLLTGKALEAEIKSPRYVAGLKFPYGGILNPAKLARGMKPLVEHAGVEVRERTLVLRVMPGKVHRIETEMGEISAPTLVLGLNGYSPRLGFFRDRVLPLCNYVIATEPLTTAQWRSIGWQHRQGIADMRVLFDYQRPTADGRIVIGGSDAPYFAGDAPSSGNYKPALDALTRSLFTTFPQLEGLRIDHAWGGTMGFTMDFTPSVGVMGDDKNIFYGVAYNGEGVAFSQTAGRIICELIAGEQSALTKLCVVNHQIPYLGPSSLRLVFERLYKWYLVRSAAKTVR